MNQTDPTADRPPMSRAEKAEALLLHFTAEAHRRKWSYDRGLDDDGVPLKSEAFDALHRLGEEMRTALEELRRTPAAASAVVAPPTDRAAVLDEAAEKLHAQGEHLTGEFNDSDILHEDGPAATVATWKRAADVLRRLAVEAHGTGTQQPEALDELATARATNQRLNYEKQRLECELAAYRRAVSQWEVSERGTYVPLRTIAAIARAAGRDIETPQWLLHYQRVEQAEAAIDRVRQLHDRLAKETDLTSPDDSITRGAAAKRIATALDGWNPSGAPQCDVEFEGGGRCAKPAGHRPPGSDDPHVTAPVAQQPAAEVPTLAQLVDADPEYRELLVQRYREMTPEQQAAAADDEETRS